MKKYRLGSRCKFQTALPKNGNHHCPHTCGDYHIIHSHKKHPSTISIALYGSSFTYVYYVYVFRLIYCCLEASCKVCLIDHVLDSPNPVLFVIHRRYTYDSEKEMEVFYIERGVFCCVNPRNYLHWQSIGDHIPSINLMYCYIVACQRVVDAKPKI